MPKVSETRLTWASVALTVLIGLSIVSDTLGLPSPSNGRLVKRSPQAEPAQKPLDGNGETNTSAANNQEEVVILEDGAQNVNATYTAYDGGSRDHSVSGWEQLGNTTHPDVYLGETHSLKDGYFVGGTGTMSNSTWVSEANNETDPHLAVGRRLSQKDTVYSHHADNTADNSTTIWAHQDNKSASYGEKLALINNTVYSFSDAGSETVSNQWTSSHGDGSKLAGESLSESNISSSVDKTSALENSTSKWSSQHANGSNSAGNEANVFLQDSASGANMKSTNSKAAWSAVAGDGELVNGQSTSAALQNETLMTDKAYSKSDTEHWIVNKDGTMSKLKKGFVKDASDTQKTSENREKSGSNWSTKGLDGRTSTGFHFSNRQSFLNTKMGSYRQNSSNNMAMVQPKGMELDRVHGTIGGVKHAPSQQGSIPVPFNNGYGRNFTQNWKPMMKSQIGPERNGRENSFPMHPAAFFPMSPGRPQFQPPPLSQLLG